MKPPKYTTMIRRADGMSYVSRYFNTIRAARLWQRWLVSGQSDAIEAWIETTVGGTRVV